MTLVLGAIAAVAAAYRVPRHRSRRLSDWALSFTLIALAVGLVLKTPGLSSAADTPELVQFLVNACALLSAFGTQVVLLYMLRTPADALAPVRRRTALTAVTLVLMLMYFLAAGPVPGEADARRMHQAEPGLLEFRGLYLAFLTWAFVDIVRLCRRFASLAGDRLLAAGLRLVAAGGVVGLGYVLAGVLQIAGAAAQDVDVVREAHRASNALIALATVLVVVGSTLPAVGSRIDTLAGSSSGGQAEDGLEPLWRALTSALPEIVLPTDRESEDEELYRRVIEVEDARLALRPLRTPGLQEAAERAVQLCGVGERERQAALEAAALALALERRARGHVLMAPTSPAALLDVGCGEQPDDRDLHSQIGWLSAVGRWFSNPELVATARRMLSEPAKDLPSGAH